ncbi:MAG: DUF3108 domain-containing protein [Dehalococcoidia bacterium]|nr:MAG: DUF3108 domain-containing protein [Dehalococcoidia bacterium]
MKPSLVLLIIGMIIASLVGCGAKEVIRVGEEMGYRVYLGETAVGTLVTAVPMRVNFQDVDCYQASYKMELAGDITQEGSIVFDQDGMLKKTVVFMRRAGVEQWATEVTTYLELGKMRVIISREGEITESVIEHPPGLATAEQLPYLLRLSPLCLTYSQQVNLLAFPDATQTAAITIEVVGEEQIDVPAGSFDCWALEGHGAFDISVWITKDKSTVPLIIEQTAGSTWRYVLESYR